MTVVEELRTDRESGARRLEAEYKAGLMTLARRFCADEGDAEELVNRTLAAVVEGIDDYLEQSAFFGWMCKILENIHAKDVRRKSNRTVAGDTAAVDGARDDEAGDRIFREVDASLLRDAIADLPADLKDALMLRYFMDLPVSRVARILAAPEGTVKWRLHCARMVLAAKLGAQRPVARLVLLALLLAAGLAAGRALYTLGTAVHETRAERAQRESHAENAESVSHAENAEGAESVFHAENAESAEPTSSTFSTSSTPSTPSTVSTPESSEMNAKSLLAVSSLALATTSASAATDHWTYTPLASGTRGTISWTDSSGFENIVNEVVLSDGLISFYPGKNTGNAKLKNLDLSIPVYAEDGTTQYAFSPMALGDANQTARIFSGAYLTNVVLHAGCKSIGHFCFKECTALVKIVLNDGLEEICEDAFRGDKALVKIDNFFPDSLRSIGVYAFSQCPLSGIAVANGLEKMGNRAFFSSTGLQGFDCGQSTLKSVEASTFYKDTALGSVILPTTVTNIDSGAFYSCTSLTNFWPLLPPHLAKLGDTSSNDRPLYDCPIQGHVVVPSTLTNLLDRSFRSAHIESFTAPRKGLRKIGEYAFSGCSYLTNIVLSADLETLESRWVKNTATAGGGHIWFRNLPANLSSTLWIESTRQNLTIHLPWSQQDAWREWVASGPTGHTFTFNKATKTLPEHLNDVGTWLSGVTQNVTWWKDAEKPTLVLIK